jgi:primosomal replication protein N
MMAGGGFVAYAGLILLLIAAAIGMGSVIPLWLSTLIVGIIALVVGFILLQSGRSTISNLTIVPEKTVESIKEDAEWVKEQVR